MRNLHLGLLITKDDDELIGPWFRENCRFFDEIVCVDGSKSDHTKRAAALEANAIYRHERECGAVSRTDHGLRSVAHDILVNRHGYNGWITLCHADEFFYHDPRKCCEFAQASGFDAIDWYAPHFVPHSSELEHRDYLSRLPAHLRFRHYHWDYGGDGMPWLEFRSFLNHRQIQWRPDLHGSPRPFGCSRVAEFHPTYRHIKVFSLDPAWYKPAPFATQFAHHWTAVQEGRTGVSFVANSIEELFVDHYEDYRCCTRFEGQFDHPWNIGESYR